MDKYVVSALKYRPTTWDSVVGQQSITDTLQNAIKNNHLAKAFLFCGPRGVGKTTTARILAKTINADLNTDDREDFAFNIFELDAASNNSVDDIRNLIDQVRVPPQTGKYKVYIVDEVHMLSNAAFNAFLKTLEEPPEHALFILATTEKHKIIPTILSRCQVFEFNRIQIQDMVNHLQKVAKSEGVEIGEDALHIIAQKADGGLRDALSMFDQIVSFSGNTISYEDVIKNLNVLDYEYYFQLTDLILENNIPKCLLIFNEILNKGFDGHHFINGLAEHFRNLMVCLNTETVELLEVGEGIATRYKDQVQKIDFAFISDALTLCHDCDVKYRQSRNQRLLVETTLMQLASITAASKKKAVE